MTGFIVLLEGPDGAGKTTYADMLQARWEDIGYKVVRVHNDASDATLPGRLDRHYRTQLLDAADRPGGVITVIDRSYLSEVVYGQVYRGRSRVSPGQLMRLERLARKLGVAKVHVHAPAAVRLQRVRARGEDPGDLLAFVAVGNQYDKLTSRLGGWTTVDGQSTTTND